MQYYNISDLNPPLALDCSILQILHLSTWLSYWCMSWLVRTGIESNKKLSVGTGTLCACGVEVIKVEVGYYISLLTPPSDSDITRQRN